MAVSGCNSSKRVVEKRGTSLDDAINIAIMDFLKKPKLYKKDTVFSILIHTGAKNEDIIVVAIGRNNTKLLITKDMTIGSKGKFPSKYLEKDGKLFFWWDDDIPLTNEALSVFKRYDLLQDDDNGRRTAPSFIIDETKKGVHYYFCKNDISKYKRVITNIGIGYYDSPSLKCVDILR